MLFRGGTSKGAYFIAKDLPTDPEERNHLLMRIMGSPDPRQIDGIGGGTFVTSKVALLNKSDKTGIDIDYKFIQVLVDEPVVDDEPTCGNLLSAVGVFALESRLVDIQGDISKVTVYDINTKATIVQHIKTPGGRIQYQGNTSIAGVPNAAAPIELYFSNISGGKTGHYLPTGNLIDEFDGVRVSCLDFSMPTAFISAQDVGVTGYEKRETLNTNKYLISKLQKIREQASQAMGLGSATGKVIPKIALVAPPKADGHIAIRYFTPSDCHPAIAVSAGFCLSIGCFIEGTVMNGVYPAKIATGDLTVNIENPSGITPIVVNFPNGDVEQVQGKVIRTARLLFNGSVYVQAN